MMFGLGSLFRKRSALDPEQWQVGDQAECVRDCAWSDAQGKAAEGPRLGETRIVSKLREDPHPVSGEPIIWLGFDRYPDRIYEARAFRKVRPRADEQEAADATFAKLIRKTVHPADPARHFEEVD